MKEHVYGYGGDAHLLVAVQWNQNIPEAPVGIGIESMTAGTTVLDTALASTNDETLAQIGLALAAVPRVHFAAVTEAGTAESARSEAVHLGRRVVQIVQDTAGLSGGGGGFWTQFDRSGINRLIKLLRRAREASFGRDE